MFHINFKRLRLRCECSIEEVAERLGLSSRTVLSWETGEALPSMEYLPILSELFTCEIKEFFAPSDKG